MENELKFDSEEERLFYLYLEELQENGYIDKFTFHEDKFILSEQVKYNWLKKTNKRSIKMSSALLQEHVYSPDFHIHWNMKAYRIFYHDIFDEEHKLESTPFVSNINSDGTNAESIIEIKPNFDFQNMTRLSIINGKWVYDKYKIFVQKIIPIGNESCLFAKTFVPQKALLTKKTNKPKKYKFVVKSLKEFIKGLENV